MSTTGRRLTASLLMTLMAVACGGGSSPTAPTPQYARGTDTFSSTQLSPGTPNCWDFRNARAGTVNAVVTPSTVVIALVNGPCSAAGAVIVEAPGQVNADAPEGQNHVRLTNPTDVDVAYSLTLSHWF